MKKAFAIIIALVMVFSYVLAVGAQEYGTMNFCPQWGQVESVLRTDAEGKDAEALSESRFVQMEQWNPQPTDNIWVSQGDYGYFITPPPYNDGQGVTYTAPDQWDFIVTTTTGIHFVLMNIYKSDPNYIYIFVYNTLGMSSDGHGQHVGLHDFCSNGVDGHFRVLKSAALLIMPNAQGMMLQTCTTNP